MNEPKGFDQSGERAQPRQATAPRPRVVGSPLSTGASRRAQYSPTDGDLRQLTPPPPGRGRDSELGLSSDPGAAQEPSGLNRAAGLLRSALPFVQRLLPLLDGNVVTAIGNLLMPHPHPQQHVAKLDLTPVEDGLTELRSQQHSLRLQVSEQNTSLKRVEDQLEMVREATDRNTLEQQELIEDLKALGNKVKMVAIVALAFAAICFLMTLALFLHIKKVLP